MNNTIKVMILVSSLSCLTIVNAAQREGDSQEELNKSLFEECLKYNGSPYKVYSLLEDGADVNAVDSKGRTPLYWACYKNNPELVKVLIQAGADVNAVDSYGNTPLYWVCYNNNPDLVKVLIQAGALFTRLCNSYIKMNKASIIDILSEINAASPFIKEKCSKIVISSDKLSGQKMLERQIFPVSNNIICNVNYMINNGFATINDFPFLQEITLQEAPLK